MTARRLLSKNFHKTGVPWSASAIDWWPIATHNWRQAIEGRSARPIGEELVQVTSFPSKQRQQRTALRRTTFGRQVRDALVHLHDFAYLQTHPLAVTLLGTRKDRTTNTGRLLHSRLVQAIEALCPPHEAATSHHAVRSYRLLHLRYVEGMSIHKVCSELGISESAYHRSHSRCLEALITLLDEGIPADHANLAPSPSGVREAQVLDGPPNLPRRLTSFVGRERELAEIERLLAQTSLLTLTGTGGSGKTRLAIEVARKLREAYSDAVWFVDLAPLSNPDLIPQVVAAALSVHDESRSPTLTTLINYLRPRRALLILDNCEHLVFAVARFVETILQRCPNLKILATSREALRTPGEVRWCVPSLSIPPLESPLALERIQEAEAVRLFVDRARAVEPRFEATLENSALLAQICRHLDGLPLAIELAAARVKVLSLDQIVARLDNRFHLLTTGSRTALPRHQTLRALVDWSYSLLSEPERILFRRLAVFSGAFSLEAAETICADDVIRREQVLDLLTSLVEKSLVLVDERQSSNARYRLLETLRQYTSELLRESGEDDAIHERHARYYLEYVERPDSRLAASREAAWVSRLEPDRDNLRAALQWFIDTDQFPLGFRLARRHVEFWYNTGPRSEGREWLTRLLRLPSAAPHTSVRAFALEIAAWFARAQDDFAVARSLCHEALTISEEIADKSGMTRALWGIGEVALAEGDADAARTWFEQSLVLARKVRHPRELSVALIRLGDALRMQGEYTAARGHYEESLRIGGDSAWSLRNLGFVTIHEGDFERATTLLQESLARYQRNSEGRIYYCIAFLIGFAGVAAAHGSSTPAAHLLGAVNAQLHRVGGSLDPGDRIEYDRLVSMVRGSLDEQQLSAALVAGAAMTLDEAMTYALQHGHGN